MKADPKNKLRPGTSVYKTCICDGSPRAGRPVGEPLLILSIKDHAPVEGPREEDAIALLDDGSWEFVRNLLIDHPA